MIILREHVLAVASRLRLPIALLVLLAFNGSVCVPSITGGSVELENIRLPEGFRISIYASDVKNARAMCWGDKGTLFVGSRSAGLVHAIEDTDGDGRADKVHVIARDLNMPVGVTFWKGDLYVSAVDRIVKLTGIEDRLSSPPAPETVMDDLPKETSHGWRFIAFGPDDLLYVPVGAPCNNCKSENEIFASITRSRPDGTGREIIAHGVRNTVGFDWHPDTDELWFTDNGRDWMGDDLPPCELNKITTEGAHFGYPYCHGTAIADPEFGHERSCSEFIAPVLEMQAHTAPLGMRFYTGEQFPEKYRNAIFIAQHGSWNRSKPVGYQVIVAFPQNDGTVQSEVFAEGWLQGNNAKGRPVDVLEMSDGSLLVSDDAADMIYRISYDN